MSALYVLLSYQGGSLFCTFQWMAIRYYFIFFLTASGAPLQSFNIPLMLLWLMLVCYLNKADSNKMWLYMEFPDK